MISDARRELEQSGLACGDCSCHVEQLVAARLAACQAQNMALASGPAAAEPTHAQQRQPATGARSRRRAAVAAHATFAVAAAAQEGMDDEDEDQAFGAGTTRRRAAAQQQQQQQAGSPGSDLENMFGPGSQLSGKAAAAGKRGGGARPLQALEPAGQLQPSHAAGGSGKRQRL